MDNCSLPSSSSTVSSNRNIGDVSSLKALKSSRPLPAQGRLWPIKAGRKERDRGEREKHREDRKKKHKRKRGEYRGKEQRRI
jgi:hypothetical protein